MRQKVFILGATGNVGSELVRQITKTDGNGHHVNPTDIIGFADRNNMYITKHGIEEQDELKMMSEVDSPKEQIRQDIKSRVKQMVTQKGVRYEKLNDILEALSENGHTGDLIIVDATAEKGDDILHFHIDALNKHHFQVVTANKNPVAFATQEQFGELTKTHGNYDYDTAVMAGAGAVDRITHAQLTEDDILSIEGCFSGTLGYIASQLETGEKKFSQIVREALKAGYTEPHPWDDLSGLDVARKLLILVRSTGRFADISEVDVSGFIDNKYGEIKDVQEFLTAIEAEDDTMAQKYAEARARGNTLKYVASMKPEGSYKIITGTNAGKRVPKIKLEVKLQEVPLNSTIGSLKGTKNVAILQTEIFNRDDTIGVDNSWELKAPGAGLETTANSLRVGIALMIPSHLPRSKK